MQLVRGLAVALWLACPAVASAATISEVFLAMGASPSPDAVELDGLASLGVPAVDLVVLDASAYLAEPIVWQVVTIPTTPNTLLISESAWPDGLWGLASDASALRTLADLGAGTNWNFTASRTLVLFDRETDLVANFLPLSSQADKLNGATPVDWLTFQRGAAASAWDGELVADTAAGYAISRPRLPDGSYAPPIVGVPDGAGVLVVTGGDYPVTPGVTNPLHPVHMPEPAVGALLAAVALFYVSRRPIISGYAR